MVVTTLLTFIFHAGVQALMVVNMVVMVVPDGCYDIHILYTMLCLDNLYV